MIRFLLRVCGFLSMAAAFAALVVDGTRSIAGGQLLQFSLADTAGWLGAGRFAALMASLAQAPDAAQRIALGLLALPGWSVAAAVGLSLLYAGRRPTADVGFSGRRA